MSFISFKLRSSGGGTKGKVASGTFKGIDAAGTTGRLSFSRSDGKSYYDGQEKPGCLNMISSAIGEICKRPGFKLMEKDAVLTHIDGVFPYEKDGNVELHVVFGNVLFVLNATYEIKRRIDLPTYFDQCKGYQVGKYIILYRSYRMYIYDCEEYKGVYYSYMSTSVENPYEVYLPTTYISGFPEGGGVAFESPNRLNPFVAEQFYGDGQSRVFRVHFTISELYGVYIKNVLGEWQQISFDSFDENSVTLTQAPEYPDLTGEDNVRIIYKRPVSDMEFGKISANTSFVTFGIGGFEDRLFMAGSNFGKGCVFFSQMGDFTYFPETNYIKVGSENTSVRALASHELTLHVICNDNIYCVTGSKIEDNPDTDYVENAVFTVSGILKTPEPIEHPPVIFDNEINYLTKNGVCAITPSGVLDERCCEIRSGYINSFLEKEILKNCVMLSCGDYLVIHNNKGRMYLFDGRQFSVSSDKPFSKRQYEAFIWEGIDAKYVWTEKDSFCFSDGKDIFRFDKNFEVTDCFADEIQKDVYRPINAYWETTDIFCGSFYLNKFFMRVCVILGRLLDSFGKDRCTDIKISASIDGKEWKVVKDYDGGLRCFDYGNIDYSRFTYCFFHKSLGIYKRLFHKKGKSIKLRFENDKKEPLTLRGYEIEYIQM